MFEVVILTAPPELERDEFDMLLSLVSPEKQERIKNFHFFRDARNCLLGDVLSRVEICRATGLSNKQLEFSVNCFGKPFLVSRPNVHFNISHAGDYIACVVADKPVGIDIEIIKPIDLKIAERFFTSDEFAYIMVGDKTLCFYEIWTKKESYIKWAGKGLHKHLTSFSAFDACEYNPKFYRKIVQNNEAICYACSLKKEPPSIRLIDIVSLMQCITL